MKIQVEYEQLYTASNYIQNKSHEYRQMISSIQNQADSLQSVWNGEDFRAFNAQLKALQPKLNQMAMVIEEYAAYLKTCGQTYQSAIENSTALARRLSC